MVNNKLRKIKPTSKCHYPQSFSLKCQPVLLLFLIQSHIHLTVVNTISDIEIPPDVLTCVSRGYNSQVPMPLTPTALTNRTERYTKTTCSRQQARLVP